MKTLLNDTHHRLVSIGVEYTIQRGTALGFQRHGGHFIPWDDDIDFYMRKKDTSAVLSLFKEDPTYCAHEFWGGIKIFKCNRSPLKTFAWSYPFIDIFTQSHKVSPDKTMFPAKLGTMEDIEIYVPNHIEEHLQLRFGSNWNNTCESLKWSHRLEQTTGYDTVTMNCDKLQSLCGYTWGEPSSSEKYMDEANSLVKLQEFGPPALMKSRLDGYHTTFTEGGMIQAEGRR
jgi:hypothetical protein